jgi:hypothetical protein
METFQEQYTAFVGDSRLISGPLIEVARLVKEHFDQGEILPILMFNDDTGQQVDIDLSGGVDDVLARLNGNSQQEQPISTPKAGPGRPKLGVVAREVTLLPRHWEWLNAQPGGASVTLRKLVERARRENLHQDRVRLAQDAAFRFMSAIAGNLPGYEEVLRSLYAHNYASIHELCQGWPADIREHALLFIARVEQAAKDAAITSGA